MDSLSSFFSSHRLLKIPIDALRKAADEIDGTDRYADAYYDIFDKMDHLVDSLREQRLWEGLAFDEFVAANSFTVQRYAPIYQELLDMASFLRDLASQMEEKDIELKSSIQSAG